MRLIPKGLNTTLDPTLLKPGFLSASANVTIEHGIIEARPGFEQLYKNAGFTATDVFLGAGFGRYNGFDIIALVVQPGGSGAAKLYTYSYSQSAGTWTAYHFGSDARWIGLAATKWRFKQFGAYLYAINETNGDTGRFWRIKVGGVASDGVITANDWTRAPIVYADLDPSDATVILERPNPAYTGDYQWNVAGWAGAVSNGGVPVADGSFYPTASALTGTEIVLTQTGNVGSPTKFTGWFMWDFTGKIDLKANRLLYFEIEASCEFDDVRLNEEIYLDIISRPVTHAWVTNDATALTNVVPTSTAAKPWKECRVKVAILDTSPVRSGAPIRIGVTVDFDHLQYGNTGTDWITNIWKFAIGIPAVAGNNYTMTLSSPLVGGNFMCKPRYWKYMDGEGGDIIFDTISYYGAQLKDAEYATVSYNAGTESSATFDRIQGSNLVGLPQVPGLVALGAKGQITIPAPIAPYTGIRVFRKRWSDSEQWYCIYQGAGGTVIVDSRVDATGDILAWDNAIFTGCPASNAPIRAADYDWGSQTAAFTGQCLTSWKGHMVVGNGAEVYFSYQGDPTKYLRPVRDYTHWENLDTEDATLGRTMYMSNTISDKVLALVAQDALYAVGYEAVYALVGDSAASASPFRKLPGSYGAMGAEAACAFQDGVVIGNASGLYYVRLSRLGNSVEETSAQVVELTEENRGLWRLLLAKGAPNDLVVSVVDDMIIACRGRFSIRRNKSGGWEYHEYSSTALTSGSTSPANVWGSPASLPTAPADELAVTRGTVKSLYTGFDFALPTPGTSLLPGISQIIYDSSQGGIMFSRSGIVFRMDKSTANDFYKTDAGYAIPWAACFGDLGGEVRTRVPTVQMLVENRDSGNAAGPVRFLAEEFDGASGSRVFSFDRAQTTTEWHKMSFGTLGGFYHGIVLVSGNAAQRVIHIAVDGVDAGKARAN